MLRDWPTTFTERRLQNIPYARQILYIWNIFNAKFSLLKYSRKTKIILPKPMGSRTTISKHYTKKAQWKLYVPSTLVLRGVCTCPSRVFMLSITPRPRGRWKIILKWICKNWDGNMDWIVLAKDRDRWQALIHAVINLQVLHKVVQI